MNGRLDHILLDLEPRDLKVYEALLRQAEGVSIRSLATATHLNRGTTFEVIKKLARLGLVSGHHKLSRKYYVAKEPSFLLQYAQKRSRAMTDQLSSVEAYISQLKAIQPLETRGRFSQLYEGEEEIALLLHDVLDEAAQLPQKTYRVISSSEVSTHMYRKFENFTRQRIRRGIAVKVIGIGGGDKLSPLAERKWLSAVRIPDCYLIIYSNKIAQISLSPHGQMQGTVVEDAGVVQLYELLFDTLWNAL